MFHDYPGKLYAARKDSPLIIGVSKTRLSDLRRMFRRFWIGREMFTTSVIWRLRSFPGMRFISTTWTGKRLKKKLSRSSGMLSLRKKAGTSISCSKRSTSSRKRFRIRLSAYVKEGRIDLSVRADLRMKFSKELDRIYIVACGSAYHVGMVGKYVLEDLADIPVEVDLASEFRYRNPKLGARTPWSSLSLSPVRQQTAWRRCG